MPPLRVLRLGLWFQYEMPARDLVIDYTPITRDEAALTDYHAQFLLANDAIPENLRQKLARLAEYAESQLTVPEIEIDDVPTRGAPRLWNFQVRPNLIAVKGLGMHVTYYLTPNDRSRASRSVELTEAARRLIDNICPMCEQLAWSHLCERFGHPA